MKIALIVFGLGATLLAYSCTLPPFRNEALFEEQVLKMGSRGWFETEKQWRNKTKNYWALRDEMLTPKFKLQDHGIALMALSGLIVIGLRSGGNGLLTPESKEAVILLAFLAPFTSMISEIIDLHQDRARKEFPPWGDSIAIPMMGSPLVFIILLTISLPHLMFLRSAFHPQVPLIRIISFRTNWWLLFVLLVTSYLTIQSILYGDNWHAFSGCLWLYFFLSLGTAPHGEHSLIKLADTEEVSNHIPK